MGSFSVPKPRVRRSPTNGTLYTPLRHYAAHAQWGIGHLADNARGEYLSLTVISDLDLAAIENAPEAPINAHVDKLVHSADEDGYATTFVVAPSIIYGQPQGPLFEGAEPLAEPLTAIVRLFAEVAAGRGRPGVIGKGANAWGHVHIEDSK